MISFYFSKKKLKSELMMC